MKQKTIFLDRDGTVIKEVNYLSDLSQICLLEGVGQALNRLKEAGYFLALVTNQSGVARGYFDEGFVEASFEELNRHLAPFGATFDAMEYCPHHKDGQAPYNQPCLCRKPLPQMIERLTEEHDLDKEGSWMLGDKLCDVELGLNAHIKPGLVLTGYGVKSRVEVEAKHPHTAVFSGLEEFTNHLLGPVIS